MVDHIKNEADRVLAKIQALKHRLDMDSVCGVPSVDDVIKTVALSTEISKELKEVLIVISSTMVTEHITVKNSSYKTNMELIRAAEEILNIQLSITHKLTPKKKPATSILKEYHRPISGVGVIIILWVLAAINGDALTKVMSYLSTIVKGVL